MEYKINELTQGMAEDFIDHWPDVNITGIRYQGLFVKAAFEVGWCEGTPPTLRKDVAKLFWQIKPIWEDANTVPNASSSPLPSGQTAGE